MPSFRALKVGLNLLHLVPGETGGSEVYARRLIEALLEHEDAPDLALFLSRDGAPAARAAGWELPVVELPVRATGRARRVAAEQVLLPAAARRTEVDLLHNLFSTAPAVAGVPQVTTILDLIYVRYPEAHARMLSLGMRVLVPIAARRSERIIAISGATKHDVVEFLGVDPATVDVVYPGPGFRQGVDPMPEAVIRRRHSLGDGPLVLSVSAHRPHKNLRRLIEALAQVPGPAVLVVPGYETRWQTEVTRHADRFGVGDRVRFLSWVSEAELEGLYQAATCLVFPSLAEGFGFPVLEAMARGVPVACSDATSLPEVGGPAALYFDPLSTSEIAAAITRLLSDADLRGRLASAGLEQAGKFSWRQAADGTLATYRRALAQP